MTDELTQQSGVNLELVEMSTDIVCAYVGHNTLTPSEVPALISSVHATLQALESSKNAENKSDLRPAVSVKKSLHSDYIICLEDGKKFKSLKRHIRTHYDLSPEEYREKWGLPANYPMVAPSYSKVRSQLARANGLGRKSN